jgi:hypothetical protein
MRRFMAGTLAGFLARDYRKVAQLHYDVAFVPPQHPSKLSPRRCAPSASRSSAKAPATFPWRGCWGNCSKPPAASTCRPSRSWCCCKKPWWWWKAWRAAWIPDFDIWEAARPVAERWVSRKSGTGSASGARRRRLWRPGQAGPGPAATGQECRRTFPDGGGRRRAAASRHGPADRARTGPPQPAAVDCLIALAGADRRRAAMALLCLMPRFEVPGAATG